MSTVSLISRILSRCRIAGHACSKICKRWRSSSTVSSTDPLQEVVTGLTTGNIRRVVVMTGAGISTASGIPDFRSPGTGVYDNLQKYTTLPYPEAIFDIDYFRHDPRPFFTFAQELYPSGKYLPNLVHYFIKLLHSKGRLKRLYTQNIDGLERLAGVPGEFMVEAHGTFATATCTQCRHQCQGHQIKSSILAGEVAYCKETGCKGVVKPDIVFFGENLPDRFFLHQLDMQQADLLIIMGTSLEVYPFAGIAELVQDDTPRILFNRDVAGPFRYSRRHNDIIMQGDLVEEVLKFSRMLKWEKDLLELKECGMQSEEPIER